MLVLQMKETQFLFVLLKCLSNVPSNIVYSVIGDDSLRSARGSNNPDSFLTSVKLLFTRMSRKGTFISKKTLLFQNFLTNMEAVNNVYKIKEELLDLVS